MAPQKLFAFFCFISVGFSAYDAIPFKNLDVKLAEVGVPQELLPMNHHTAAQRVKNARYIFGVGQNLSFYSYPKAVNFDKLLFPQSSTAAFVEMLFPNPHMFAANQSPDAIAKIRFETLGLLARHLVRGDHAAAIDTFANAITPGTNSSSPSFDEATLLEFQRISFYQEIRRQTQELFDAMTDEDDDFFKDVPEDKRIAHVIMKKCPEWLGDAADLLESGFFDDRSKPAVPENLQKLQNETFIITLQKAIAEVQLGAIYTTGMLVEVINTFAWQKFKSTTVDILDYYKGITGSEELDLDFEQFSFEQIKTATKQLEEDKCFDDLPPHFRTAIVKYTLIQAAPPFSGVRYRSATYIDPASKRKTALGFADCVESQARAFFNGIVHQATELGIRFNPNLLLAGAPVGLFYQDFPLPEHISMQEAHDKFAGLAAKQPGVKYATPKNQHDISKRVAEVWAGKLNLVKVLCHMSGCYSQLESVIAGITAETAQNCLESAFLLLSTHLSRPGFSLEFDCDSDELTYDRTLNDFVGDILGKVNGEKTFLLKSNSGHGELKPLVKQKHTWLNDLPSVGSEFHALPADLKHYVYMGMPSEILATLAPELQQAIILNCPLDDIDTQIDRSIHCFAQSNLLVRELALPIAHKVVAAHDFHSTGLFVSSLLKLIRGNPNCLTEHEFKSLSHDNFLDACYYGAGYFGATYVVSNDVNYVDSAMTAYGYKKGWLDEASLDRIDHLGFSGWNELNKIFSTTPFSNADYIKIIRMCPNLESLSNCDLPKDHASASQFVSAITHLPKLTSLGINLSDHTARNPLFTHICDLPKSLEMLTIYGTYFNKSTQSVLIEATIDCVNYLPALKSLSIPFSNADYINIIRMCPNLENLSNCDLPKDHASASQFVSAITHLPKLTSLSINLSDHTARNPLFTRICDLPKSLEKLIIYGIGFKKSAQSVLIEAAIDYLHHLPALKYLSMCVENEEMLRSVLSILRTEALPTERIAIGCAHYEDWQTHRTRVSGIYQEVLGHEYPENN